LVFQDYIEIIYSQKVFLEVANKANTIQCNYYFEKKRETKKLTI